MPAYQHVLRAVSAHPWAMTLDKLQAIGAVLSARASGVSATSDEIRASLGVSAAAPASRSVGSTAVIPVFGTLSHRMGMLSEFSGGTSYTAVRSALRGALADPNISAILLEIDSPGGNVDGLPELADEVYAARGQKPIGAIANTMAASAAYWLGSQVDDFAVTPSGVVGSIGVYLMHIDESQFNEKAGLTITYISAGEHKTEGNPDEPLSDEAKAYLQSQVDAIYGQFIAAVARGRGVSKKTVRGTYGQGRVLMAEPALEAGMVDRIATLDEMVGRMASKAKRASRVSMASVANTSTTILTFEEAPGDPAAGDASEGIRAGGVKVSTPEDIAKLDGAEVPRNIDTPPLTDGQAAAKVAAEHERQRDADDALLAAALIEAEQAGA
jgi:signal peptide peptidase SppA